MTDGGGDQNAPTQIPTSSVRSLFNAIAPRYDFLNHFLSFGIDVLWRRELVSHLRGHRPELILDVATGTGDLALALCKLQPRLVVGIDPAAAMLKRAQAKIARRTVPRSVLLVEAAAEHLPFPNATFDAVTVAFGIRNFADLSRGIQECLRILKPGGRFAALEFSKPHVPVFRQLYQWYFRSILPVLGGLISRQADAYQYLPDSVERFPGDSQVRELLRNLGFDEIMTQPLTLGITTFYTATRPLDTRNAI